MKAEGKLSEGQRDMLVRLEERSQQLATSVMELKTNQIQSFKDLHGALEKHATSDDVRFDQQGGRLGYLEKWRTWILGGLAFAGVVGTVLMWLITTFYQPPRSTTIERRVTEETQTTIEKPERPKPEPPKPEITPKR